MAYEQRDNSGSLFSNDRKEKDSHPDFKGTAMIDGIVYWVSGWTKHGQRGDFTSLAFKRKDDQAARAQRTEQSISQRAMPKAPAARNSDMNDDIPF
jgi:hypothetical protein